MEYFADKTLFFPDAAMDRSDPLPDPREAKYQLAERLVDNIRFGEAIRILETLGDYGDSPALLKQVRALKAYQDDEERRLKAERKQQALERDMKEARDRKRRRVVYLVGGVLCVLALVLLK